MIDAAFAEVQPLLSTSAARTLLGKARATHYRWLSPAPVKPAVPRCAPANQLDEAERWAVLDVLRSPRFVDASPAQVWATLLDEGRYLCWQSSMYRLLRQSGEIHERRAQASHPARVKPELVATAPMHGWSWDITKLRGPDRGVYYDLYVILDIYSRYVPGWLVAPTETAELATQLIADAVAVHDAPGAVHADRGTSMTSKPVAQLLVDLGVDRSHSRPRVSNDNPFSEAQFKTLKYCPAFPDRFGCVQDARRFCELFFSAYNHEHRHSGIGLHTPASVHFGTAAKIREERANVLTAAYATHPERFSIPPTPPALPGTAWINQPTGRPSYRLRDKQMSQTP